MFVQQMNMHPQVAMNSGPPVQNMSQAQPVGVHSDPAIQSMNQAQQSDPAMIYYQNLVAQGYPHEHAVAYTQQYYPQFRY